MADRVINEAGCILDEDFCEDSMNAKQAAEAAALSAASAALNKKSSDISVGEAQEAAATATEALANIETAIDTALTEERTTEATLTGKTLDDISNHIGADHVHYTVRNESGATIPKNTIVTAHGTQGNTDYLEVTPLTDPLTQTSCGITNEEILNNDIGLVMNKGVINDMDTSMWSVGDVLYPNSTGGLTSTKPTSGQYQFIGKVMRSHNGFGRVLLCIETPNQYNEYHSAAIAAEDNAIDFSTDINFELTATAANITATGLTGIVGKGGTILVHSAENITGWGAEFSFKTFPNDLTGDEVFAYFIENATTIWIGRVQ